MAWSSAARETATHCPCGNCVTVDVHDAPGGAYGWMALCRDCYGPVIDSGPRERVYGTGATPEAALVDWQERVELAWDVDPAEACPIRSGPGRLVR